MTNKKIIIASLATLLALSGCQIFSEEKATTKQPVAPIENEKPATPSAINSAQSAKDDEAYKNATSKSDPALCDRLSDENLKSQCKYEIVLNKALAEKNQKSCLELKKEEDQTNCEREVLKAQPTIPANSPTSPGDKHPGA